MGCVFLITFLYVICDLLPDPKFLNFMAIDNRPMIANDDSTEVAIRRIEMDYNGDTLSAGGYALY